MSGEHFSGEGYREPRATHRIELHLMPEFALRVGDEDCVPPVRAQRLIALLALGTQRLPRTWIASTLWPDSDPAAAMTNLRSTLQLLRQVDALCVVHGEAGSLGLDRSVTVDWVEATVFADRLISGVADVRDPIDAMARLHHSLLSTWDEPWLVLEQERFEEHRAQGLEALSRLLIERRAFAFAARAATMSLSASRFRESAYQALIVAQVGDGNRAAAVDTYRRLYALLRDELGIEPGFTFNGV